MSYGIYNKSMTLIISHRGNLRGREPEFENHPDRIDYCISMYAFDVEIDVWFYKNNWWLGHDEPKYKINESFLMGRETLWLHAKNSEALFRLLNNEYISDYSNIFWHENDQYSITSKGYIWTLNNIKEGTGKSILLSLDGKNRNLNGVAGVCSDFPIEYRIG